MIQYKDIVTNFPSLIWKNIFTSDITLNQEYSLDLDLREDKVVKFIEELVKYRIQLPNLKRIDIQYPKDNDQLLKDFLRYCFPQSLPLFLFNYSCSTKIKMEHFIDIMKEILGRVTKEVYIS